MTTTRPVGLFGPKVIGISATLMYTSPASPPTVTTFTRATVVNVSNANSTLTVWVVRLGLVPGNGNIVVGAIGVGQTINAGPSEPYAVAALAGLNLNPGDAIYALAGNANALQMTGSGWTNS